MFGLDLDAGEHCQLLADHVGCDGDGAPANEISRATCEAKLHHAASARIRQLSDLIAEEAELWVRAKRETDALL